MARILTHPRRFRFGPLSNRPERMAGEPWRDRRYSRLPFVEKRRCGRFRRAFPGAGATAAFEPRLTYASEDSQVKT